MTKQTTQKDAAKQKRQFAEMLKRIQTRHVALSNLNVAGEPTLPKVLASGPCRNAAWQ